MKDKDDSTSRREWILQVGAGSVAAGAGILGSCRKSATQSGPVANARGAARANVTPQFQVFCHGMMVFQLPPQGATAPTIRIHIPTIDSGDQYAHAYMVGPAIKNSLQVLKSGGQYTLALGGGAPAAKSIPANMVGTNFHLSPSCGVKSDYTTPGKTPRYCYIDVPMPDEYHGCNQLQAAGGAPIFDQSNPSGTAVTCDRNLSSLYLIQVFRYNTFSNGASLADSGGTSLWNISQGLSLHIYAEPKQQMPASMSHLPLFNQYFNPPLNLTASNTSRSVTNSGQDAQVQNQDLWTLAQLLKNGSGQGGDVADCINGYGT